MAILTQDGKVLANGVGIIDTDTTVGKTLLHIDTDLQQPNRIQKSDTDNKVRQITDKAQNIAFVQTDPAKQPVYNYGGYYSFDGGDLLQSPVVNLNLGTELAVEFWFRPRSFADGAIQFIYRIGEATFSAYCYFSVGGGNYTFVTNLGNITLPAFGIPAPSLNTWHHLYWSVKGGNSYAYYDGYLITYGGFSVSNVNSTISIGQNYNALYGMTADIANFNISDKAKYYGGTQATKVFDPVFSEGFTHFQRYPDNGSYKAFFSSKYLKDTVIDSSNSISSLKSSIGTDILTYSTNKPKYSKSGLLFASGQILQSGNSYTFGTANFYIGFWANPTSNADIISFGTAIKIGKDSTNDYFETNGVKTYATQSLTGYRYYTLIRKLGVLYFLMNGVLQATKTENIDYSTGLQLILGGTYAGLFDEILPLIGDSILNPATWTSNPKKFEPPIRGEFDGIIKQY